MIYNINYMYISYNLYLIYIITSIVISQTICVYFIFLRKAQLLFYFTFYFISCDMLLSLSTTFH